MRQCNIQFALAVTILISLIVCSIQAAELEIRQNEYTYKVPLTRDVTTETFVITVTPPSSQSTTAPSNSSHTLLPNNPLSVIHFLINSSWLSPEATAKSLERLNKLKIPKTAPLAVNGYACPRGTDEWNQRLSQQRAETVAAMLREHGYTVQTVHGKGVTEPVATDPGRFYLNRRVEIGLLAQ